MRSRLQITLILAYVLLGLGGLLLHARLHPPSASLLNWWPLGLGVLNITLIPLLFLRPGLVGWGMICCWLTVIAGTLGMAYYAAVTAQGPWGLEAVFLRSTFPDILMLWTKLPLSLAIWQENRRLHPVRETRACRQ